MYAQYKARVAALYRGEIDGHLFATASHHPQESTLKDEKAWREWLRARWAQRAARWSSESADD